MEKSRRLKLYLVFFATSWASQAAANVTYETNANTVVAGMWSEIESNNGFRLGNRVNSSTDLLIGSTANDERLLFHSRDNDSMDWEFSWTPQLDYKILDYASWTGSSFTWCP